MFPAEHHIKLSHGTWGEDIAWEFYLAEDMPPEELCSAVFCLALHDDDSVVLTKTRRGWEMLGGHIEAGETVEQAMLREAHEEGGYTPQAYRLFGYRKVVSGRSTPTSAGRVYPFPISYIPHFVVTSGHPLVPHHGEKGEVLDARAFSRAELEALTINESVILQAGLATAPNLHGERAL